jgi:hypothetical protein
VNRLDSKMFQKLDSEIMQQFEILGFYDERRIHLKSQQSNRIEEWQSTQRYVFHDLLFVYL